MQRFKILFLTNDDPDTIKDDESRKQEAQDLLAGIPGLVARMVNEQMQKKDKIAFPLITHVEHFTTNSEDP